MFQMKSVHPALIAIWPPNNAVPAAHICPPLETGWAMWPLPMNFGSRADGRMLGVGSCKL
ncbi:hypothetical protein DPMN_096164 [Dreissena polymorpha]|uniref:Uncharacterized protein n=1 Tax=Dreissena polymorpha TaxID=45954 RepID=A0A9D4LAM5_DREPO|nr:hypothetical protein DPMN_096164 [Dreissena polymorpha]